MTRADAERAFLREANKRLKIAREGNAQGRRGTLFLISSFVQGGIFAWELLQGKPGELGDRYKRGFYE